MKMQCVILQLISDLAVITVLGVTSVTRLLFYSVLCVEPPIGESVLFSNILYFNLVILHLI